MSKHPTNITKETLRLFYQHAMRYPKFLIPLLVVVPLNIVLSDILAPLITSKVLEKISTGAYDPHQLWASFGPYLIAYAITIVMGGIVGWRLAIWLIWRMEIKVIRDIAERIFAHLLQMSANFHANRFGGSLVSQSNKLISSYVRFIDTTVFDVLTLSTALIAAIAVLATRVPIYSVVMLVLTLIFIVGIFYYSKPVREASRAEAEADSNQTGALADSISNVMAVKSFAGSKHEQQRFRLATQQTYDATMVSIQKTTVRELFASSVTSTISIAALFVAVFAASSLKVDIATVYLIVAYTSSIGSRLWSFQNVLKQYNRAIGDADKMVQILQIKPGIKDPLRPEKSRINKGRIEFNDVDFTHAGASKHDILFSKLNLSIKPGEKIGLVGHSGSGKTTLTRILLRFSDIDGGEILIDGQNIAHITQDDLRRSISYVPQEPLLFHRSIRENIAYGKPDATDDDIIAAAKKAHAHEFIKDLAKGYDTIVGERGVKLSGGQRQRVAIARAILKDAPILVLDEATSALDSESEVAIQKAIWQLMKGRTALVVAHRLSTIQKMDRIVVLDKGKIIEQGSHQQLLKAGGIYAKLWAHQSGGFIEE